MTDEASLLEQLEQMLKWKKSKAVYAEKLDVSLDELNRLLIELRSRPLISDYESLISEIEEDVKRVNVEKGTIESTVVSSYEPKNDDELAQLHKVDLTRYKISSYWTKQRGDKFTSSLLCTLIKPNEFSQERFETFLKGYKSDYQPFRELNVGEGEGVGVDIEISLVDVHLDKLDITEESVADRKSQYIRVLTNLLGLSLGYTINKIVFVVGSDLFHTDTYQGTTTKGTPLDINTTWFNAYEQGFDLMVKAITLVSQCAASVEVILVQGNHAKTKEYYLAHALQVYFGENDSISFNRKPTNTKYAILGNTFVGYHHGDCKIEDLPLIFATAVDSSVDFGRLPYREVHTGDKHHYLAKEIKGVRVQQLPSLAGTDRWHSEHNFVHSIRAGLAMVYSPTKGKIAEFEERI